MFTFSGSLLLLQCYDLLRYFFGRVLHLTLLFCLLQLDLAEAATLYHHRGRRPVILSDPPCPTPRPQSSLASPFTFGFVGCLFSGHWSIAWSTTALSGHPLERAYTAAWGSPQAITASCTVIVLIRSTSSAMPRLRYVREEDAT
jgi:hypothetical protein